MSDYIELIVNNNRVKINRTDSYDIWTWRDYKLNPHFKKLNVAKSVNKRGYARMLCYVNKKYFALSRITYKAHNPEWDLYDRRKTNQIDHINRDSEDNRIENLRILTSQQNNFNRKPKGVSFDKGTGKWQMRIMTNRKVKTKICDTKEEAEALYWELKAVLHKI
jgi:hypothetical protein